MLDTSICPPGADLLAALADAARPEDTGRPIDGSVTRLLASGAGDLTGPDLVRALIAVAEANLPLARLYEGHVNAVRLIHLLGGDPPAPGILHGVWGADGTAPVAARGRRLSGAKRYCSGLGSVARAVVTVGQGGECRLAVVDVSDAARHRPGTWAMQGMRATLSGDCDLTGLRADWLGGPGDYFREPSFLGGVWRIAACQVGGTLGLLGAARDWLATQGRLGADAQVARLSPLVARAMAACGLVERAAAVADGPAGTADPDRAVALSLQARLLTEDLAQDAVAGVERSVGLAHFAEGSQTGRIARDLATYCRQAARDAFEQRAGTIALGWHGPLSGLWHG
ncbi:acyl-CoA dehydrogenase [Jannaschia sp. LMIT008]|uniref:acyl-CoA dehydrogenase n=1 Tax=Jannaschia maritima TaxID=3032585 RepID=UPI0028122FB3|nr:acyl-CoA dehydrogenase [Jannaschia sp. LMIT008]